MRIGVIGAGRIGGAVIAHLRAGGPASLVAVLRRSPAAPGETADPVAFLARDLDLILDCAGPRALATLGPAALGRAEVWSLGAAALADPAVASRLAAAAAAAGTALRLLPGALAGLDGVAAAAAAGATRLTVSCDDPALAPGLHYRGPLRAGARAHPDRVNVAVAAALAGPGIDATRLLLRGTGPGGAHRLSLATACSFGRVRASVTLAPPRDGALHPAAASLIAALQARLRPVRAG
jgi:aspartate dehydrogenase